MATNLSPEQKISHSNRRKLGADKLTYDKRGAITDFFSIGFKLSKTKDAYLTLELVEIVSMLSVKTKQNKTKKQDLFQTQ